jgi:hypothetical protein
MDRRTFAKNIFLTGLAARLPEFDFLKNFSDYRYIQARKPPGSSASGTLCAFQTATS